MRKRLFGFRHMIVLDANLLIQMINRIDAFLFALT